MNRWELRPSDAAVLGFTAIYVGAFLVYYMLIGNYEFIWYVLTVAALIGLVLATRQKAGLPPLMLWALSIWGLVHMAGGGIPVGDGVLYNHIVVPLVKHGELRLLRFDQLIHFYGFAVSAWVLWHLLNRHFDNLRGTATIYVYPALASMGLGAINELIEFAAVLLFPDTNVGGYYNTALDLAFNALGAIAAMLTIYTVQRHRADNL